MENTPQLDNDPLAERFTDGGDVSDNRAHFPCSLVDYREDIEMRDLEMLRYLNNTVCSL